MTQEHGASDNEPEHGRLEVAGAQFRYFTAGSGGLVLMLDVGRWRNAPLIDALARDHRVVSLTLPEMSTEAIPESVEGLASLLILAAGELTAGKYTLIGESSGASAALWQALLAPSEVEALALISPTAVLPLGDPLAAGPEQLLAHPENESGLLPLESLAVEDVRTLLSSHTYDAELEDRLGEVPCATLAVFGLNDRMVAPEAARVYREKIPNCNISLVYDAGHAIIADRPKALTSLVTDFVERRETFIVGRESGLINP